jgi:chromosomal replication initiation ATPase DnaA
MIELDEYAKRIGISVYAIRSRSRRVEIVAARQVWWWYLRGNGYGLSEIGRMHSVDHSTVWHGVNRVSDLIRLKDGYLERYLKAIENE